MIRYQLPPAGHAGSPARRWLQTAIAAVAGVALLVLGFFFALFAIAAALLLVAVVAARFWWIARRFRAHAARGRPTYADTVVEGEYQVVERDGRSRAGDERRPYDDQPR